jgi:hypothetical protein
MTCHPNSYSKRNSIRRKRAITIGVDFCPSFVPKYVIKYIANNDHKLKFASHEDEISKFVFSFVYSDLKLLHIYDLDSCDKDNWKIPSTIKLKVSLLNNKNVIIIK